MEDLQIVEHVCRIPREDMHKVYCDRMLLKLQTELG
jgi:hypothetical protein